MMIWLSNMNQLSSVRLVKAMHGEYGVEFSCTKTRPAVKHGGSHHPVMRRVKTNKKVKFFHKVMISVPRQPGKASGVLRQHRELWRLNIAKFEERRESQRVTEEPTGRVQEFTSLTTILT